MIVKNKKYTVSNYTIIELLVVIVVMAILFGVATSGLKSVLGRQGATGAVRTISAKMSLARSFAVSRNRYVAMLMPDHNSALANRPSSGKTESFPSAYKAYLYSKTRLCYVTADTSKSPTEYVFDSWIEGYEWQDLPKKTAAYISTGAYKVYDTEIGSSKLDIAGVIYKPSGVLVGASSAIIKVYRAYYNPDNEQLIWQGKETEDKGWDIQINPFTGRANYEKK